MTYATKSDLIKWASEAELVQLTDLADPPAGAINDDLVTDALESADAEINSYLAQAGLATPLPNPPRVVVDRACAIARFRLSRDHASDRVTKDFDDALSWLLNVAKGNISLGDVGAPAQTVSSDRPKMAPTDRKFTNASMRDW